MLKTEQETPESEDEILTAAVRFQSRGNTHHHHLNVDFEHGQHWLTCTDCGSQWSIIDAEGPGTICGFDFEQVSDGDGSCDEGAALIRRRLARAIARERGTECEA